MFCWNPWLGKGYNPWPWQQKVGHCVQLKWHFLGLNQPPSFLKLSKHSTRVHTCIFTHLFYVKDVLYVSIYLRRPWGYRNVDSLTDLLNFRYAHLAHLGWIINAPSNRRYHLFICVFNHTTLLQLIKSITASATLCLRTTSPSIG